MNREDIIAEFQHKISNPEELKTATIAGLEHLRNGFEKDELNTYKKWGKRAQTDKDYMFHRLSRLVKLNFLVDVLIKALLKKSPPKSLFWEQKPKYVTISLLYFKSFYFKMNRRRREDDAKVEQKKKELKDPKAEVSTKQYEAHYEQLAELWGLKLKDFEDRIEAKTEKAMDEKNVAVLDAELDKIKEDFEVFMLEQEGSREVGDIFHY